MRRVWWQHQSADAQGLVTVTLKGAHVLPLLMLQTGRALIEEQKKMNDRIRVFQNKVQKVMQNNSQIQGEQRKEQETVSALNVSDAPASY